MKIIKLHSIVALSVMFIMVSCSGDKKTKESKNEEHKTETKQKTAGFVYNQNATSLEWTAYKTSDKIPVKGTFNSYKVSTEAGSENLEKFITSTSFEIESNSAYTGNPMRDKLLVDFFFGVMMNTQTIKGSFKEAANGKGLVVISLNDVEFENPFSYKMKNDTLIIESNLKLVNWNGQKAVESINEKCLDMHRGPDGVSKTWDEVDVLIKTKVN